MADYVPKNDSQFGAWLANFLAVLEQHLADFGLQMSDFTPLDEAKTVFDGALSTHIARQAAAKQATEAKKAARKHSIEILRPLVRRINNHPAMTNELRAALGLPVKDEARTNAMPGEEVPDIYLEAVPGKIIVHFGTAPANEKYNGKPSWARGCNIYRKKNDEEEYTLIAFETASPYIDIINGPAADYTYVVQYRGTRASDVGNVSTPATIAAGGLLVA